MILDKHNIDINGVKVPVDSIAMGKYLAVHYDKKTDCFVLDHLKTGWKMFPAISRINMAGTVLHAETIQHKIREIEQLDGVGNVLTNIKNYDKSHPMIEKLRSMWLDLQLTPNKLWV